MAHFKGGYVEGLGFFCKWAMGTVQGGFRGRGSACISSEWANGSFQKGGEEGGQGDEAGLKLHPK